MRQEEPLRHWDRSAITKHAVLLMFDKQEDAAVIRKIESSGDRNAYIRSLVEKDLKREAKEQQRALMRADRQKRIEERVEAFEAAFPEGLAGETATEKKKGFLRNRKT